MKNHKSHFIDIFKNIITIKNLTLLLFTTYFLVGLIIFSDYGISYDENANRDMGFRVLNNLRSLLNLDIYSGFENSDIKYVNSTKQYGVIFDLPLAFIEKLFNINSSRSLFLLRHFAVFFIFFISLIFFYFLIKKRFNENLALLGVIFLILTPRVFAESFYNMKDIIFLSFFNISLYFAFELINKVNFKNSFISAFTCSLALNSRIIGIIIPLIIVIFLILIILENKGSFKRNYLKLLLFLSSLVTFTIILWPYLWTDPLVNFLTALKTMGAYPMRLSVFYFGNYISSVNLPWHYSIVWILITTPILYIFLFLIGSVLIFLRTLNRFLELSSAQKRFDPWVNNAERMDLIVFLIIYFTIFLIIYLNATLYGGWRHLYFIYPSIIYVSIKGLSFILKFLHIKYILITILPFLLHTGFWMVKNHPYQYAYFNFLTGKNISKNFELDYWGLSNLSVLSYILNNNDKSQISIFVSSMSPYFFSTYMLNKNDKKRIKFVESINEADYLVTNHYYQKGNPTTIKNNLNSKYKLIKEFKVDNMTINSIYKVNNF
jgi:hypothetical protein